MNEGEKKKSKRVSPFFTRFDYFFPMCKKEIQNDIDLKIDIDPLSKKAIRKEINLLMMNGHLIFPP